MFSVCCHELWLAGHGAHGNHVSTKRARNRCHLGWSFARSLFFLITFPTLAPPFRVHLWWIARLGRGHGVAHVWVVRPGSTSQKERLPRTTARQARPLCIHYASMGRWHRCTSQHFVHARDEVKKSHAQAVASGKIRHVTNTQCEPRSLCRNQA